MDPFFAARTQMALTLGFHIVIVCVSVVLPLITVLAEWRWLRTGELAYRELARRWAKATGVLFAVGVVSGTVLAFQMGTLWPGLMDRFGQVIGLAFTLEGMTFFLEAIFIGIYLYGWDRLPPRVHLLTGLPIVAAGFLGSIFVISVNSWMQNPRGFELGPGGEVIDVQPWALFTNPMLPHQAAHMIVGALMVGGFLIAGVYATGWLRGRRNLTTRLGFTIPFTIAAVAAPLQIVVGDIASRVVAEHQPLKFAAMEAIETTTSGVPLKAGPIEIPYAVSLLTHFDPHATILGMDEWPVADRPPDGVVHFAFQLMVGIGVALAGLALWYGLAWWRRRDLPSSRLFWIATIPAGGAAAIALLAGWTVTEVGRQPWIVYGVMRTSEAVNPAGGLAAGLYVITAVYLALGVATVAVLRYLGRVRS
jgi:cytochrome bd ubiquinol oxidase subunit I